MPLASTMTLDKAIKALQFNTEWKVILDALRKDRSLIIDFHQPEILENPQALARLGGEIASIDRIIKYTYESEVNEHLFWPLTKSTKLN